MADNTFDEMEDDFDDHMSDILDDSLEEVSEKKEEIKKTSFLNKIISPIKDVFKKALGSTRTIIIIAVSVALLIGLALVLWFFVFKSNPDDITQPQAGVVQGEIQGKPAGEKEILFDDIVEFEPFERIALKTSSTMGKLSLKLSLELTDARYRKQIYTMEDQIRKIVTEQVANTTWLELRNSEGKIMLKYNLLERINALFPKATVRNVYFTYFIMQ
ncbi:MAG: flagellar basal body-associated FliL family protein [Pseudomonadota bacterium]